jgi:hypothetical protein
MHARLGGIRPLAAALADRGMLAPGLTASRAADIIWTLGSPETYHLLVTDRGWDPEDYQSWLTLTLERTLLPPAEPRRTAAPAQAPARMRQAERAGSACHRRPGVL